jgi:hypothetical protein
MKTLKQEYETLRIIRGKTKHEELGEEELEPEHQNEEGSQSSEGEEEELDLLDYLSIHKQKDNIDTSYATFFRRNGKRKIKTASIDYLLECLTKDYIIEGISYFFFLK